MDAATIARLNAINREFYRVTANEFDATRGQAWLGWEKVLEYLPSQPTPLSILDVGCGNGRFSVFLRERGLNVVYHGMDNSQALLDKARVALPNATLELRDIVDQPPDTGTYDVVVLFGVLHHIPSYAERQHFMKILAERVAVGGILAFACWRFYEYERFRARIVAWDDDITVEKHDYLLDWRRGERALRYCHYVDDAEHAALIAATGLREITSYRADGEDEQANKYSILKRE